MDDFQMNFVIDDKPSINVTQVTSNLKKGSWKRKRLDAKRIVSRVKKEQKATNLQVNAVKPVEVPVAKQEEFQRKVQSKPIEKAQKAGFTSSIFTANPIPVLPKREKETVEPVKVNANVFSDSTFKGLGLDPILTGHLEKLSIIKPTAVQRQSIPELLKVHDRDVIIQAQTGSGKTFSFLLPILNQLIKASSELEQELGSHYFSRATGSFAVILVPTRELAQQIAQVLDELLRYTRNSSTETEESKGCRHWIVSGIIVGGESRKSEKARLRKGMNILVCTPGRLLDHLKTTEAFLVGNVRWLVLDEADNLLHLGFEETLKEILMILNEKGSRAVEHGTRRKIAHFPYQRQTILCSATIEGGVQKLAEEALRDPLFIKAETDIVSKEGDKEQIQIPKQLKQHYVLSPAKLRLVNLIGLLRKITESGKKNCKIIVFLATGDSVDWHFDALHRVSETDRDEDIIDLKLDAKDDKPRVTYNDLAKLKDGYNSFMLPNSKLYKLHGSLLQQERLAIFSGFSPAVSGSSTIMFCTDVAARGLDVRDVTHIVQYDPPADVRDYIHRIGRTARIGRDGSAYIFLLPSETDYLELLEEYQCHLVEEPIPSLLTTLEPLGKTKIKAQKHKPYEIAATDVHMTLERFVHSNQTNLLFAQKAFSSHIRAYTTHIASEKHIFHIRKLHLGHLAKSFCLREAPQVLQSKIGTMKKEREKETGKQGGVTAGVMKRKASAMMKTAMISEFADGDILHLAKKK